MGIKLDLVVDICCDFSVKTCRIIFIPTSPQKFTRNAKMYSKLTVDTRFIVCIIYRSKTQRLVCKTFLQYQSALTHSYAFKILPICHMETCCPDEYVSDSKHCIWPKRQRTTYIDSIEPHQKNINLAIYYDIRVDNKRQSINFNMIYANHSVMVAIYVNIDSKSSAA